MAARLGLDEFMRSSFRGIRVAKVEELLAQQTGKHRLAFVGDGINDAPVLSRLMWELPWEAWFRRSHRGSGYCAYGR